MPVFAYRALDASGQRVAGREDGATARAVERLLATRGLYPLEVERVRPSASAHGAGGNAGTPLVSRQGDVSQAVATLAELLDAGLTLDKALGVAAEGALRSDVSSALRTARRHVREGGRLHVAFERHPRIFRPVAVGLVRAGERGGHLADAMRRLAEHLERERSLRSRLLSALIYPSILVTVGAGVLVLLVFWVLPRFVELLGTAGAELPRSTALLLGTSAWLGSAWPVLLLVGAAVVGGVAVWRRTPDGRRHSDALLLAVPVVGRIRLDRASAHLARTLASLAASGHPLVPSLGTAARAAGDVAVGARIRTVQESVRRGRPLSAALRETGGFPHLLPRLVEIGEETGELERLLDRVAALLEDSVERRLERLVAMVEPALILTFGVVIGLVAVALLQAIYGVHANAF